MEAYDSGTSSGDMEYALTNLFLASSTSVYGCGDNMETVSQNLKYVSFV